MWTVYYIPPVIRETDQPAVRGATSREDDNGKYETEVQAPLFGDVRTKTLCTHSFAKSSVFRQVHGAKYALEK